MKVFFLAAMVLAAAGILFYFGSAIPVNAKASQSNTSRSVSPVSLPMFFEANQGQTDSRVKFLSRGHGYGLFLTADEAVLTLHVETRRAASPSASSNNVIRMRLDGANSAARVSGAELLPGKSNYFIGNNPSKWHRNIPQFARVNYESVYPGVDLTYYGNQGQLEYDFRVAPGADPGKIALKFDGASTHIDSGDLVLSTSNGDVRFRAPYIYQPDGKAKKNVAGSFRQLADKKIGFEIGNYDHSRELVIDPALSYFTYLGGSGTESNTQVAIDAGLNIYLAGSTDSTTDFPITTGPAYAGGATDVFVAKLNPAIPPPQSQLIYATYLGGNGADDPAGIAVDVGGQPYVAGTTTSSNFPTTTTAFQTSATGTHGFLTKFDANGGLTLPTAYSTYLAGDGVDTITGVAIDTRGDAFVTGTTTSTDSATDFPSTPSGYQLSSLATNQFFASKLNTNQGVSGAATMLYSTYFGGANPTNAQITGGGIAIDNSGNMYFTGATSFLFDPNAVNDNPRTNFPILNAQQACLDQPPAVTACDLNQTALDAFVAKINPNRAGTVGLAYSTYLGGSFDDAGLGVAVDSLSNAYVTGKTLSPDWTLPVSPAPSPFQSTFVGTGVNIGDAFLAKIGNPNGTSSTFPLTYFTYLGGTGDDVGQAIAVDSVQAAHVVGTTGSPDLPVFDPLQDQLTCGTADAFVAQILTTASGKAPGDSVSCLGGSAPDRGLGIAVDVNNTEYVAGETQSSNFPRPAAPPAPLPFQSNLNGPQDAFLVRIGQISAFAEPVDTPPTASPNPASLGNQVTFTFTFVNNGPDPAAHVVFSGSFPTAGVTFNSATATPGGTCPTPVGSTVLCNIGSVAVAAKVTVTVVLTPTTGTTSLNVAPSLSADGGPFVPFQSVPNVPVTDFAISAAPTSVTINAGDSTSYVVTLTPLPTYSNAISVSDSGLPTGATGTFTSTSVTIPGNSPVTTTLNIKTTARPVNTGSLLRGGPLYATWLPVGGLSLLGLGVGAGFRRRRWLAGMLLGLLAGVIILQAACGSSSSTPAPTGGTPAGTYTVTFTGSSGSASHNTRVTLIVN